MKNKHLFIFAIVVLSLLLIGQVIINRYKVQINRINKYLENSEIVKNHLDAIIRDQFTLNGKKIDNWKLLGKDGKVVKISDFISKEDCIFFIFSEYTCFDCVKKSFDAILKNLKEYNRLKLICGFDNIRKVQNWATENNFSGEIYLFEDFGSCIFSKYYNYPYLFKVNNDLQIVNVYSISQIGDYISLYFTNP
jgi:hypothetical protein